MFKNTQNEFNSNIKRIAENAVIKRLNKEGLSRMDIADDKFNQLVEMQINIIKEDGKKVGAGLLGGIALTVLTGGLF